MKIPARPLFITVILMCLPLVSYAEGGGGIGLLTNVGSQNIGAVPLSGMLDYPTGTMTAAEVFGYGVTSRGWKIGGFGIGFYGSGLSHAVPAEGLSITGAAGGFGGVISGGAGSWGDLVYSMSVRLGAGGMAVEGTTSFPSPGLNPFLGGAFALYGAIEVEIGVTIVPAMLVSGFLSLQAVAVPTPLTIVAATVPTMGIRMTWGRF